VSRADAVQSRRAAAKAAGKCGTCCNGKPLPGRTTCGVCLERSRKSKARVFYREYAPLLRIAPAVDVAQFDVEADRREEWLALNDLAVACYVGRLPWVAP
jgi:hypothetical protein